MFKKKTTKKTEILENQRISEILGSQIKNIRTEFNMPKEYTNQMLYL